MAGEKAIANYHGIKAPSRSPEVKLEKPEIFRSIADV